MGNQEKSSSNMPAYLSALAGLLVAAVALMTYLDKKESDTTTPGQHNSALEKRPSTSASPLKKN